MSKEKISELPKTEIIESRFTLEELRRKASAALNDNLARDPDVLNAILCLANEIQKLKEENERLKESTH